MKVIKLFISLLSLFEIIILFMIIILLSPILGFIFYLEDKSYKEGNYNV